MKRAALYIRVSTEEQAREGVSLEAQEVKLKAYCSMQGIAVEEIVREEGVSASKALSTRAGGQALLKTIEEGRADQVVAFKLDRLFRDAEDALHQTKAWDKQGVALHLVDMGGQTINTATAMGRFFLNMMAGFAELERNLISERTSTALSHKRDNLEAYGPTPYGFTREGDTLQADSQEGEVVVEIKALREEGLSLRKIADLLNNRGERTKKGGKWHASTIKYILENELYTKEAV